MVPISSPAVLSSHKNLELINYDRFYRSVIPIIPVKDGHEVKHFGDIQVD